MFRMGFLDFSVEAVQLQVVFYVKKYLMGNVRTPGAPLMPVAFKQPRGYAHFPFQIGFMVKSGESCQQLTSKFCFRSIKTVA